MTTTAFVNVRYCFIVRFISCIVSWDIDSDVFTIPTASIMRCVICHQDCHSLTLEVTDSTYACQMSISWFQDVPEGARHVSMRANVWNVLTRLCLFKMADASQNVESTSCTRMVFANVRNLFFDVLSLLIVGRTVQRGRLVSIKVLSYSTKRPSIWVRSQNRLHNDLIPRSPNRRPFSNEDLSRRRGVTIWSQRYEATDDIGFLS